MNMTLHASKRSQQRGIPPLIIDWLQAYGDEIHDHKGACVYFFSRRAKRQIEKSIGSALVRRYHEKMNTYAVVSSDGHLITVGMRFKHARR